MSDQEETPLVSRSPEVEEIAEKLYEQYCASVGGKAFNGDPLPGWKDFRDDPAKEKQAAGWLDAAEVAIAEFSAPVPPPAKPHPHTSETKKLRADIDDLMVRIEVSDRKSRSRSLAFTYLQIAKMFLGADLGEQREEGITSGNEDPYPGSNDPNSPVIHPQAA